MTKNNTTLPANDVQQISIVKYWRLAEKYHGSEELKILILEKLQEGFFINNIIRAIEKA